jgi:RNA recognition motif-containing protein
LKDYIETFCGAGIVKNCNIFKRPDGKSKGSGIVKFATTDDARMALKLKDTDFMGRRILMREDSRDHVAPRNSSRECRVFVSNLPYDVTRQGLRDHMETCGAKVKHVTIFNRPDGKSKGSGIVEFGTGDDTRMALKLNRRELMGRQIFVRADREEGRDSRDFKSEDERLEQMLNELEAKI